MDHSTHRIFDFVLTISMVTLIAMIARLVGIAPQGSELRNLALASLGCALFVTVIVVAARIQTNGLITLLKSQDRTLLDLENARLQIELKKSLSNLEKMYALIPTSAGVKRGELHTLRSKTAVLLGTLKPEAFSHSSAMDHIQLVEQFVRDQRAFYTNATAVD